ncbi:hypothetical protein Acr_05g0016250 [Actinidia rufa]|uniref:Reverse transcriptase domain-containing protein n=1 Tax=Actinidia rufa TaxID=165716 RepID=A0A7J0EP68_9ERIC|nr:hypothetical protein Acr_05g0016250 [Actinidia rufa]
MLLGDFNNVLSNDEKANGLPVTSYETRDFRNCCYDTGISDMRSSEVFLTWSNNSVWSKLDRAMVNKKWVHEGFTAQASFDFPEKYSDHSPCTVTLFEVNERGVSPFKFFNMWANHDKFLEIVSNSWGMQLRGTAMYKLCRKLKAAKDPLRDLNKKHFSHIAARTEAAEEDLIQAQQQLHDSPRDYNLQIKVPELRAKVLKLTKAELSFCTQLAKAKFLKNADKGTKFFHDLIKSNRSKNHIASILLEDGSRTTSSNQVNEDFVQYYKGLLGSKENCSSLNKEIVLKGKLLGAEQADSLLREVTDEEIKSALFDIGEKKAPGPDGYTSCFYKKAWDVIGRDFMEAVKEFFSSGHILKQINHSVLALIPKTKDANRVEDFRPIACCNVLYNVISKIIASRLAPTLSSIVDPAQSAFIQNRSMIDNIFLLQELLKQYGRKRASPRCILNVDLRKAFDSIDWVFLQELLSDLHFPPKFVGWGLRQGDPLSPYLFVICLEYLSRGLGQLKDNADFNFHPKCGGLTITHLAFADDLVLFSKGDPKSVSMLMENLNHFGDCSGLKVSFSKSSLFAAGINSSDMEAIKDITTFSQGSFSFRYLGILVADSRLTISQYSLLLIKSQIILVPGQGQISLGVKAKIVQLCKNFLWSGNCNSHKRPLVAWEEVTLPKSEGDWASEISKPGIRLSSQKPCGTFRRRRIPSGDEIIAAEDNVEGAIQRINQWTSNGEFQSKKAYDYFRPRRAKLAWPKMLRCRWWWIRCRRWWTRERGGVIHGGGGFGAGDGGFGVGGGGRRRELREHREREKRGKPVRAHSKVVMGPKDRHPTFSGQRLNAWISPSREVTYSISVRLLRLDFGDLWLVANMTWKCLHVVNSLPQNSRRSFAQGSDMGNYMDPSVTGSPPQCSVMSSHAPKYACQEPVHNAHDLSSANPTLPCASPTPTMKMWPMSQRSVANLPTVASSNTLSEQQKELIISFFVVELETRFGLRLKSWLGITRRDAYHKSSGKMDNQIGQRHWDTSKDQENQSCQHSLPSLGSQKSKDFLRQSQEFGGNYQMYTNSSV